MYDKRKLIILRAVLIAVGAAVGGTAMWQYFVYYPDVMRRELQIVIIVFSAIALAALLYLSAKPLYKFGASVGAQFIKLFSELGAKGVVAVVSGLITGGMLTFLFDFLIRGGVTIIAVRVLLDVLVFAGLASLCCFGFVKWIAADDGEETAAAENRGYLLTASAFFDERVFVAASSLINVKISSAAFKALWKYGDAEALARLKLVAESGRVDVIKQSDVFESAEEYENREAELAAGKRLVPVFFNCDAFAAPPEGLSLDIFGVPSGDVRADFVAATEKSEQGDERESAEKPEIREKDSGEPNGEIIIDK